MSAYELRTGLDPSGMIANLHRSPNGTKIMASSNGKGNAPFEGSLQFPAV